MGVAVVAIVVIHHLKKPLRDVSTRKEPGSLSPTKRDKQVSALSGNSVGLTARNRMKWEGKNLKSKDGDKTLVWEARKVTKDYGVCWP